MVEFRVSRLFGEEVLAQIYPPMIVYFFILAHCNGNPEDLGSELPEKIQISPMARNSFIVSARNIPGACSVNSVDLDAKSLHSDIGFVAKI